MIADTACESGCTSCVAACPVNAIALDPVRIDLGRCTLCGDCAPACPTGKLSYDNDFRLAATRREALVVSAARPSIDPV